MVLGSVNNCFLNCGICKKPMVSRKEFCAMDVVSFLPNQAENWQRKPDFQISIRIESSFLLCNFVDTKPAFCVPASCIIVLCFYIFVLHLHLLMRLEIVLCQKALLIILGFTSSFSSLSRQASVGYC